GTGGSALHGGGAQRSPGAANGRGSRRTGGIRGLRAALVGRTCGRGKRNFWLWILQNSKMWGVFGFGGNLSQERCWGLGRSSSGDLRVRVICRRAAARRLGVGDSTATAWVGRWRRTGSPSAVTPPAEPPDARDQRARLFRRRLHRGEGFSAHIRPRAL